MKKVLVTGAAGFIGAALVNKLLINKDQVVGIDNLNDYYSKELKKARLSKININKKRLNGFWEFYETSIESHKSVKEICSKHEFDVIVHLAAQAGVRYSLKNPQAYIDSNIVGFGNILEICRENKIKNFIFASSSSVYGINRKLPFSENDNVDYPISLYAATKKSNELMAHSYSHLYQIPTTGLRFFTVYGPWGRPDMAPMIFAKAILSEKKISIFNHGEMSRDFTYIDDIVEGLYRCCDKAATPDLEINNFDSNSSFEPAPYRIFNIGNSNPINLLDFIDILEDKLGKKAIKEFVEMQPGDVMSTYADTKRLFNWVGYKPTTSIEYGTHLFASWYKKYYKF